MVIDLITYNGEKELFDLRYNILKDVVDEFIVCEGDYTHSGNPKPLYFKEIQSKYDKVTYHVIDSNFPKEWLDRAKTHPLTNGEEHWAREFIQRELTANHVSHLDDEDILFVGDCDEIWDPTYLDWDEVKKLKLRVYANYLNVRSNEEFWGGFIGKYKHIKKYNFNYLKNYTPREDTPFYGWHFTNMGGIERLRQKLESYGHQEFNIPQVKDNLQNILDNNLDYIGRNFTFKIDESDWPPWLKEHRQDYQNLLK